MSAIINIVIMCDGRRCKIVQRCIVADAEAARKKLSERGWTVDLGAGMTFDYCPECSKKPNHGFE